MRGVRNQVFFSCQPLTLTGPVQSRDLTQAGETASVGVEARSILALSGPAESTQADCSVSLASVCSPYRMGVMRSYEDGLS